LDDEGVRSVSYEETEHYFLTRRFLNDYKGMVDQLLGDG
jgi:predicted ATPase